MAKIRKFASIAVLPELRNGDTTPESGIAPRTPPEISSISQRDQRSEAEGEEEAYSSDARRAMRKALATRNANSAEDRDDADKAPLFADRGQHQVGVAGGNHAGIAHSGAGAPWPAGRERPQRVRNLIAAADVIVPGREPHGMRSTTVCGAPIR